MQQKKKSKSLLSEVKNNIKKEERSLGKTSSLGTFNWQAIASVVPGCRSSSELLYHLVEVPCPPASPCVECLHGHMCECGSKFPVKMDSNLVYVYKKLYHQYAAKGIYEA
ncbi:hypothetical protein KQX54_019358 [Cotesia glomerata]|uniref:Uncharacterized protein n=1 Tax=Cotesia glomerata TaxID=32391 RepID=A0AAV7I9S8_COTGL|nr:hypothetical protein KQX54_019358 [Cotesia glomerata]